MSSISTINSKYTTNYSIEETQKKDFLTRKKTSQIALFVLATLIAVGAGGAIFLSPPAFQFLPIPFFFIALATFLAASKTKDYTDPEKLKLYSQEAQKSSLQNLILEHGLKNLIQWQILSPSALKKKFNHEIQDLDFTTVLSKYPIQELLSYKLIAPAHVALLNRLKKEGERYLTLYRNSTQDLQEESFLAMGRIEFHYYMGLLENEYNEYKKGLIESKK